MSNPFGDYVTHFVGQLSCEYTNPDGTLMSGSGIPTDEFAQTIDHTTGITLGIEIGPRQSADMYTPTESVPSPLANWTDYFTLPSGAQSTANGSPVNNSAREATSDMLVVGGPTASLIAEGYKFELTYKSTNGANLDAFLNSAGQWTAAPHSHYSITDNGPHAENSEQGIFFGGNMPLRHSSGDITLSEISPTGFVLASEHAHLAFV